jgi:hypothetical protein
MHQVDSSEGRHAAMHSGKTRKPLILSGRKSAIRPKGVVARHESGPGSDQVRNGDGEIGCGRRAESKPESVAVEELEELY